MLNMATQDNTADTLLDIRNLRIEAKFNGTGKEAKTTVLVDDISFTLQKGKVLGLIGESGAGKSTIGLTSLAYARDGLAITGGQIFLNGQDLLKAGAQGHYKLRGRKV